MAKTIVGLFDTFTEAQGAVQALVNKGFPRDTISIAANNVAGEYTQSSASSEEWSGTATGSAAGATIGGIGGLLVGLGTLAITGVGPIVAAGPLIAALTGAGVGAVAGGLIGALTDIGVPEEEAGYYAEGVRRGGTLVTVNAEDSMVDRAVDILEDHNAVDVDQRASSWKQTGWTGYSSTAKPYTADEITRERERYRTTPSTTAAGAAATSTRSIPPQQTRRDTSVTGGKETTLPVIEEEVEKLGAERGQSASGFAAYDADFRKNFTSTYGSRGKNYTYEKYAPAYRYGHDLVSDKRYSGKDWSTFESDARRDWETRNPGQSTWEDVKDAVRYAWDTVRGRTPRAS